MIKYRDTRNTISIDLPEECGYADYSVECSYTFDKVEEKYWLSMGIKRKDIGNIHEIDSQYISSNKQNIKQNICRIVEYASLSGYFNKYIEGYEYTYKCFDRGNELFEAELLNGNTDGGVA